MMERRGSNTPPVAPPSIDEAAVAIARAAFADWLRAEREARGISLEDVARITKIQIRTLERLEDAAFDELPADVFVRGFIRNYARVVGLNADAALARYDDCGVTPGPAASARMRAQSMIDTFGLEPHKSQAPTVRRLAQGTPSGGTALGASPPQTVVTHAVGSSPAIRLPREPQMLASGSLRMQTAPIVEAGADVAPVVEVAPIIERAPAVERASVVEVASFVDAGLADGAVVEVAQADETARIVKPMPVAEAARVVDVAPVVTASVVEETPAVTDAPAKKRRSRGGRGRKRGKKNDAQVVAAAVEAMPVVEAAPIAETPSVDTAPIVVAARVDATRVDAAPVATIDDDLSVEITIIEEPAAEMAGAELAGAEIAGGETAAAVFVAPPLVIDIPRLARAATVTKTTAIPVLTIDDDDPEEAGREQEMRADEQRQKDRGFLPPALLDEARPARQAGLTLAVIILLILATLTLSYLMRPPGSSGEGVTQAPSTVAPLA
jgi:hypothetical protein